MKRSNIISLAVLLSAAACNLDKTNPNAPTQSTILNTREGIVGLAVGLQARYGSGLKDIIVSGGLISDELGTPPAALQSYKDAETGVLSDTYDPNELPWQSHYATIKTSNDLLKNAGNVTLGDSTLTGILSLAYLFKGASLGELMQLYQKIILDPPAGAFVDRPVALARVLALLDSALTQHSKYATRAEFDGSIRASTFNVRNTILAMQARYRRLGGDWTAALAAANAVDTSVVSLMPFTINAKNPMFIINVYVRGRDTLRTIAETGDARIPFQLVTTGAAVTGTIRPLRNFAQWATDATPISFYWPGEVMLIKAEALANTGQLVLAAQQVNYVRTRCGGTANQPKACLAALPLTSLATQAQIIAEIYKQRKFELLFTGNRWEDTRRLGLVSATSAFAKRCWLLYPNSERNTNTNVPANPSDPPSTASTCGV